MVEKIQTWDDNWNEVIRTVIFQDQKLKEQMLIPEKTTIIQFIEKYFIKDAAPDELLTNEAVRIAHYDAQGYSTGNKNVRLKYKELDIYVKESVLYNATNDRIKSRCNLICERLKYLLQKDQYFCGLRFGYEDDYDMWTKVVGYKRYHLTLYYKTTV